MKSARLTAFEILYKIETDGAYSNLALDEALNGVSDDKAFISALVYGTVERKLTLDYFIKKYTHGRIKPKVRIILRLGAYQLLFMDKVPASAAINESVNLAKEIKQDYYAPLVNAVLHKIDADRQIPDNPSLKFSVPDSLLNMWYKQYGADEVNSFLPYVNGRPPLFAVPNTMRVTARELADELAKENVKSSVCGDVLMINSPIDIARSEAFGSGLFYIEDLSSYECARALGAKEGETVLDVCSAPGGKAFAVALGMKNTGAVHAFDLHSHRCNLIERGAARLGLDNIKVGVNDASVYNPDMPLADKILCDVPCSGFGIVRRKPEIRYKDLDSIGDLPPLQLRILEASSNYLKTGGTIIYSTCTLNKKENEKVVNAFLENHSNFTLLQQKTAFPSANGGDGFYYAKMIKNS